MSDRSHAVDKQGQVTPGIIAPDPTHHGQGHDDDRGDVIDGQFGTDHAGIASASENPFNCREVLAFGAQVEDRGFAGKADENRMRGEGVNGGTQRGDKVCPRVWPSLDDGRCDVCCENVLRDSGYEFLTCPEAPVQCRDADSRAGGDLIERDCPALLLEGLRGGVEDATVIARGVRP